jgi:hypothetical protein
MSLRRDFRLTTIPDSLTQVVALFLSCVAKLVKGLQLNVAKSLQCTGRSVLKLPRLISQSIAEMTELNEKSLAESRIPCDDTIEKQTATIHDLESAISESARQVASLEAQVLQVAAERDDLQRRLGPVHEIESVFSQVLQEKMSLSESVATLRKEKNQLLAVVDERTAAFDRRAARLLETERIRSNSETALLNERIHELEQMLTGTASGAAPRAGEGESRVLSTLRFEKKFLSRFAHLPLKVGDGLELRPLIASVMFILQIQQMAAGQRVFVV